jgi:hypothetical protein
MSLMTLAKLQQKIAAYEQEGWVKISERPFERLCNVVAPKRPRGADSSAVSQSERTVSAKLCAIIAQQGKTSAATALFNSRHQEEHPYYFSLLFFSETAR